MQQGVQQPESLREVLPLTRCPIVGVADFSSREMALKCETFANMQPRPLLMRALLPLLKRLEPIWYLLVFNFRDEAC